MQVPYRSRSDDQTLELVNGVPFVARIVLGLAVVMAAALGLKLVLHDTGTTLDRKAGVVRCWHQVGPSRFVTSEVPYSSSSLHVVEESRVISKMKGLEPGYVVQMNGITFSGVDSSGKTMFGEWTDDIAKANRFVVQVKRFMSNETENEGAKPPQPESTDTHLKVLVGVPPSTRIGFIVLGCCALLLAFALWLYLMHQQGLRLDLKASTITEFTRMPFRSFATQHSLEHVDNIIVTSYHHRSRSGRQTGPHYAAKIVIGETRIDIPLEFEDMTKAAVAALADEVGEFLGVGVKDTTGD